MTTASKMRRSFYRDTMVRYSWIPLPFGKRAVNLDFQFPDGSTHSEYYQVTKTGNFRIKLERDVPEMRRWIENRIADNGRGGTGAMPRRYQNRVSVMTGGTKVDKNTYEYTPAEFREYLAKWGKKLD